MRVCPNPRCRSALNHAAAWSTPHAAALACVLKKIVARSLYSWEDLCVTCNKCGRVCEELWRPSQAAEQNIASKHAQQVRAPQYSHLHAKLTKLPECELSRLGHDALASSGHACEQDGCTARCRHDYHSLHVKAFVNVGTASTSLTATTAATAIATSTTMATTWSLPLPRLQL